MLGHNPKLRRDLQKKGRRAFAKVRDAKKTHYYESFGTTPAQEASNTRVLWKLMLRVEPEGENAFDANVEEFFGSGAIVEPSERHYQFVVLFDPSDHTKVVIDHSDEASRMLDVQQFKEQADARVSRMRERGQDFWADRVQAAQDSLADYVGTDRSKLTADEREDALHAQQQKVREIMAGDSGKRAEQILAIQRDPSILPDQKRARITELMSGMGVAAPNMMIGSQPPAAAPTPDPAATADALTKLAALHDRGVLTDAEFQAQKTKLLGT
jgi:vacuolar-type H+-ATPase subunit H